jgi:hypothetical protein
LSGPQNKFEKHMNDEWGIVEAIKDKLPPAIHKHKAMKIAKVISVMHTNIVGLQCLDVITNLLKVLS